MKTERGETFVPARTRLINARHTRYGVLLWHTVPVPRMVHHSVYAIVKITFGDACTIHAV